MARRLPLPLALAALTAMAALAFPLGSSSQTGVPHDFTWAGTWSTNFGEMKLEETSGRYVSGDYTHDDGKLGGTVTGNRLEGRWNEEPNATWDDRGTLTFNMSADGQSFSGLWKYDSESGPETHDWTGTCTGGECATNGTRPPPDCGPSASSSSRRGHAAAINEVRVVAVTPDVQYHKAGAPDDDWCVAEKDTVLRQGDEISCDPDGSVTLQFADNSTVVVRNTSQLKIASFFTEGGVVRTEILLKMGEVAAKVNKSEATKSDFRIKWPSATASVRDTAFKVFADPVSKVGIVSTTEGTVKVDPSGGGLKTALVRKGKEVEVGAKSMSELARIGKAGARGGVNRAMAAQLVDKVVERGNDPCGSAPPREKAFSTKPAPGGWAVGVKMIGYLKGTSKWKVKGGKAKPKNLLAKQIKARCRYPGAQPSLAR